MKKGSKILVAVLVVAAVVGGAFYFGNGENFQGRLSSRETKTVLDRVEPLNCPKIPELKWFANGTIDMVKYGELVEYMQLANDQDLDCGILIASDTDANTDYAWSSDYTGKTFLLTGIRDWVVGDHYVFIKNRDSRESFIGKIRPVGGTTGPEGFYSERSNMMISYSADEKYFQYTPKRSLSFKVFIGSKTALKKWFVPPMLDEKKWY